MRRLELGSSKLPWGRASLHESGTSSDWDEYVHDLHQMRLKHVRADVKQHMKTPRSLVIHKKMHTSSAGALKKSSQQEERYQEIERANRALLNRLSSVMRKPGDVVSMVQASSNANTHATLNEGFRKKELKRIDSENEKLVVRIEKNGSTYSRKAWAKDRNQQEKYLKNLSRYRNGPQQTALRVVPKQRKKGKKGRLRAKSQRSLNGGASESSSGDITGYHDWRRQKHLKKKKWSNSLPPLDSPSHMLPSSQSQQGMSPGMSFERSDMRVGATMMRETNLGSSPLGGRAGSSLSPQHDSPPLQQRQKGKKERVQIDNGQTAVPDHTKVFEAGRQMNGVFAVVSAITRGSSLIIQAFVPEDQSTTEVEVTPAQAKYAMRNVSSDVFRPEKREELCRALVAKVEFFFKDSKRMLLFNKRSTNGDPTAAPTPSAVAAMDAGLALTPPSGSGGNTRSSPTGGAAGDGEAEEEEDDEERSALEGIFLLIDGYQTGGTLLKSKWIDSVNGSDRVKTVLRSEILCGYPSLRALRLTDNYQNELHQLRTRKDGAVTVEELLLFAQDVAERRPAGVSQQTSWRAACRMYNRSQRKSGRHVLFTLHNWSHLRVTDIFGRDSAEVWECQLPPVVSDTVRRGETVKERVDILKEYIEEEGVME